MSPTLRSAIVEAERLDTDIFTQADGNVFMEGRCLSPAMAAGLEGVFLRAGDADKRAGSLADYRTALGLHHSLHDAIVEAARHSPDRWRAALGFLPSADVGSSA